MFDPKAISNPFIPDFKHYTSVKKALWCTSMDQRITNPSPLKCSFPNLLEDLKT